MAGGAEHLSICLSVGVGPLRNCIETAMVDSQSILAASRGFGGWVGRSSRGVAA